MDDKELREGIWSIIKKHKAKTDIIASEILALLQQAIVQARKEQMVIDWEQAGKDVEEARRQEQEKIFTWIEKLRGASANEVAFCDHLFGSIRNTRKYRQALKGGKRE